MRAFRNSMALLLLLVVLVTAAGTAAAQISVGNSSSAASASGGASSLTWSHTIASGSNRLLIVNASMASNTAVSSITYGGTALTLVGARAAGGPGHRSEIWSLTAPAVGTANLVVTLVASTPFAAGATDFHGVNQATPLGTYASAIGNSATPSVTVSSASGELVIDAVALHGGITGLANLGQTFRWSRTTGSGGSAIWGSSSTEPGAASVTMAWTMVVGSGAHEWAAGGVSIKPGAGNTAPTLDNTKTPVLAAENEDAGAPSGAVGTLVSSLVDFASPSGQVDNVTDPDGGALLGIAVATADVTNGSWFYSTNNGSSWSALGSVSGTSARLLAADANSRLYFQPNADYNGTIASAITFRAWDQTSGANGGLADPSTNGGSTAFSTATDVAALTITAVNDAPTITSNGGGATASVNVAENATAVTTVAATDVDGTSLTYGINGGADAARFTINSSTGALAFASAPNFEAPSDVGGNNVYDVTVQVSDGSLTDTQAIAVTVTAVNDNNPVITSNGAGASASVSVREGTTAVTTVTATDADLPAQTLTYSISGGPDAAKFTINGSSGVLAFVSAPSYGSPTDVGANNVYDVTVQVSDGSLTDTQAIAVTIQGTAMISLGNVAIPTSPVPNQDVTFTATHNNIGNIAATSLITVEGTPANTDFKLSSASFAPGSSGLTAAVGYSNNGGATYAYTPVSGAGGAPAGYDRTVTHLRWSMTGNLSPTSPNNSYSVSFQARVR